MSTTYEVPPSGKILACTDLSLPYIFVSYSHQDHEQVMDILQLLQENHFRFWYDEGIASGSQWDDVLYERITGCTQFVCFFSHRAVLSEHVKNEVHLARKYGKHILPVFLDDVALRGGLELALDRQQSLKLSDYTPEEFQRQLCRSLDRQALKKISATGSSISHELQSRYQIISQIGNGFSGNVYLAKNVHTGGNVVIKQATADDSYIGDSVRRSYRNECRALSMQASFHAPVAVDFMSDEHNFVLVETFMQGTPLNKLQGLTDAQIVDIFIKTAKVLQTFHNAGIVHCDMKPDHIFVHEDQVYLVDFGASHIAGQCNDNHTIGTLHYAAPEQFRSPLDCSSPCTIDGRTDIFALGKSLLFTLAANHGLMEIMDTNVTGILDTVDTFYTREKVYTLDQERYCDEVHPLLRAVVEKMTAEEKTKRFRSMDEVARCLAAFLQLDGAF